MTIDLIARVGIRSRNEDKNRIAKDGWPGWIDAQLALPAEDSGDVRDAINSAKLSIEYAAGEGHGAVKEERPLSLLRKSVPDLWHLVDWEKKMGWEERVRPADELAAATHLRTALTDAQLREAVTDFWRDHFSVNRDAVEDVAVALPAYDQNVLRQHALGNFRELLEAVATSTAMLAYLNNASSKASPANENYARELFELHTLGVNAYFNDKYDRWRDVPGADDGTPEGYIDEDVYEAARAFTGWTYQSGQWIAEGEVLQKTGQFHYLDKWHDPYQKRFFASEVPPYQPPMSDGRKVLDIAAFHPATAMHIASRLCIRFVSDAPSDGLVRSTAQVFRDHHQSADQMAKVIRHILLSEEFAAAPPRLQRPHFLFASLQRVSATVLPPSSDFDWMLEGMGHKLYRWPSPAGHPLKSGYWQSPGLLVRRWRMINEFWQKIMAANVNREWPSLNAFVEEWAGPLNASDKHKARAVTILRDQFGAEERGISFKPDDRWVAAQALSFLTATHNFQAV